MECTYSVWKPCIFAILTCVLALLTTAFEPPVIQLPGRLDVVMKTSRKPFRRTAYIHSVRPRSGHRFVVSDRCGVICQMQGHSDPEDPIKALQFFLLRAEVKRAESEAKRAAKEAAKQRERADKLREEYIFLTGKRWVCFSDLVQGRADISSSTSLCLDNGFVHPQLESLHPNSGDTRLPQDKKLQWSEVGSLFQTDIFGANRNSLHRLAHCISQSRDLSEVWHPVCKSMLGKSLSVNASNDAAYTGIIHQPYNCIAMRLQEEYFDTKNSVAFCPALTYSEMVSHSVWEKGYCALCIASDAEVFKAIGAVDGDFLECTGDDPRVAKALQGFRDVSAILINIARSQLNVLSNKEDMRLARALRKFFRQAHTFVAPFPSLDPQAKYKLVRFSPAVAIAPGTTVSGNVKAVGHPAPMPIALVAKSLNSWLSFLLRTDSQLQGALRGLELPKGYRGSESEGYCSLFPMCDLDETLSCPMCLANLVMLMHPMFDELNFDKRSRASIRRVAEAEEVVHDVAAHSVLREAARILAEAIDSKASLVLLVCAHAAPLTGRWPQNPEAAMLRKSLLYSHRVSIPFESPYGDY